MSHEPLIQLRGVTQRYGRVTVLEDVDLDVHAGEVLGLIGPNGGGKSTALLLMSGLVSPSEGTVHVGEAHAADVATQRTGSVGLITADAGVYPLLTGWENLRFFGRLFGLSPADTRSRSEGILEQLHLTEHMDRRTGAWSSGMKQKLSLARAQLMRPQALLLDEPTANLDPLSAETIHRTVREAADTGLAVVLVTHDLAAADALCDRVAILEGRVKHVEALEGERRSPTPSRLLTLYETHVEAR